MFNFTNLPKFEVPTATRVLELNRQFADSMIAVIPHKETKDATKKVVSAYFSSVELFTDQFDNAVSSFTAMCKQTAKA